MRFREHLEQAPMTLDVARKWCDMHCRYDPNLTETDKPGVFNARKIFSLFRYAPDLPFKLYHVHNYFYASNTSIKSLENCPDICDGEYVISFCRSLKNLVGLPKQIDGHMYAEDLKLPLLRLLLVKGVHKFYLGNPGNRLDYIFNKHYKNGDRSAIVPCQDELIEAGFEWAAKL